jgi:WD40 repeat protein
VGNTQWSSRGDAPGHTSVILSVALSADGHVLVSGDADGTVWVWAAPYAKPEATLRGHTGAVWRVALSADEGLAASASWDGTARVWDLSIGACLHVLRSVRRYANLDITGLTGVTHAQRAALLAMGAVESS